MEYGIKIFTDINLINLESDLNAFIKHVDYVDCKLVASDSDQYGKQIFTTLVIYKR